MDALATQLRRHRAVQKATAAQASLEQGNARVKVSPLMARVEETGSQGRAARQMLHAISPENLEERFTSVEQRDQIEALLLELKERQPRLE